MTCNVISDVSGIIDFLVWQLSPVTLYKSIFLVILYVSLGLMVLCL